MKKRFSIGLSAALLALVVAGCGGGDSPTGAGGSAGGADTDHVKIVSMSPADETVGLEGLVELKIEFDRPVSRVVAVLLPDALGFSSDEWLLRSADGKMWTKTISIRSGRDYHFIVAEAIGEDSTRMERPEVVVFTSRETLPEGTITGKVSTPAVTISPVGTVVLAYDANRWQGFDSINDPDILVSFGYVEDDGGAFVVDHLHSGNYYLLALKYDFETSSDGVVQNQNVYMGIYGLWAAYPEFEKISLPVDGTYTDADIDLFRR